MANVWPKPQGAPRGLLRYYILRSLNEQPRHGYELIRSIEDKTHGAWRPGPGSVYPILRELVSEGYIRAKASRALGRTVYEITEKGSVRLSEASSIVTEAAERFQDIKRIFFDLAEPQALASICLKAVKTNAQMLHELVDSRPPKIDIREKKVLLNDIKSVLEQERAWVDRELSKARRRST
jgi:DNA-binding PadR family transcriptional regulator